MPSETKDPERVLDQPYPPFLELLETDRDAALAEFERCARAWLRAHPTHSMRPLTAAERQDVVDETVRRCVSKDGEPLRNYSDMWGTFGAWLSSVAENTCTARYRQRPAAASAEDPARPLADPAATKPRTPAKPKASAKPAAPGHPARPAKPAKPAKPAPRSGRERPSGREPGTGAARSFLRWTRSPVVLVPVAVVAVAIAVVSLRSGHGPGRSSRGPAPVTGPIDIVLVTATEARSPQYDLLDLAVAAGAGGGERLPVTAIFRSGRLTVLRLPLDSLTDGTIPTRLEVVDEAGTLAWRSPLDAPPPAAGAAHLRVDPRTIEPGEYTIRVVDAAGTVIARSVLTIVAQ